MKSIYIQLQRVMCMNPNTTYFKHHHYLHILAHTGKGRIFKICNNSFRAGVAQLYSDELQAGWLGFNSRQGEDFSLLHSILFGSGEHPASYPMGIKGSFPGGKVARVCARTRMVKLYLQFLKHFHGVVIN
jgi:hypothetical protein